MKASFFRRYGGPEVLEYGELPDPVPAAGEVLVEIHAASINAADWKMRGGAYGSKIEFPHVPGRDFSGVVLKSAGDFKPGDAVFGVCEVPREGAYAEKIAIRIQGGAGGVGGFAVALAKHLGARVIATASASNHDYVRSLGADEVIDYRTEDFTKRVKSLDAVFDTVGGEVTTRSFAVLRPGGRLASVGVGGVPASPRPDVTSLRPKVDRDRPHLDKVAALVAQGVVPLPAIVEYPLAKAADAHRVSEGRHLRGKLVLRMQGAK